ncbi:MAG: PspC domain-containing protein [Eubacterium sp.]|nr:PspC domain-containing protein [Eubacterium sp.]
MKKRLYRDTKNQVLSGVCSGIAKYFDIDPVIIRVIWVLITLAGGSGIIAYIVCMLVIPEEPDVTEVDWTDVSDNRE